MLEPKRHGRPPVYLTQLFSLLGGTKALTKEELAVEIYGSADALERVGSLIAEGRKQLQPTGKTITAIPFDRPGQTTGYRYKIELTIDQALQGLRARTGRARGYANGYAEHTEIVANNFPELQGLVMGRLASLSNIIAEELADLNNRVVRALRAGNIEELAAVDPDVKQLIAKEEEYYESIERR